MSEEYMSPEEWEAKLRADITALLEEKQMVPWQAVENAMRSVADAVYPDVVAIHEKRAELEWIILAVKRRMFPIAKEKTPNIGTDDEDAFAR
jgi:hypothetical protein